MGKVENAATSDTRKLIDKKAKQFSGLATALQDEANHSLN